MIDGTNCVCEIKHCKWYRGHRKEYPNVDVHCKAFPFGIPDNIATGEVEHNTIIEGQVKDFVYAKGVSPTLVKPFLHRNMIDHNQQGNDALCSIIHDIYLQTTDREIRFWCRMAMRMSKNAHLALGEYQAMLMDLGVEGIEKESRIDWQLRPKSLYRKVKGE